MPTAFEMVERAASWFPNSIAIVDADTGQEICYQELVEMVVNESARINSLDLKPGSIVSVFAEKSLATIVTVLALDRLGLVPALLNARLKGSQALQLVEKAGASAIFLDASLPQSGEVLSLGATCPVVSFNGALPYATSVSDLDQVPAQLVRRQPDDPEFIFYTSGTTSLPKAVLIPMRATEPRVIFMSTQVGHVTGRRNRVAGVMPLFHVIGFYAVLLMALSYGGTYYIYKAYDPKRTISDARKFGITSIFMTPTHVAMLLEESVSGNEFASIEYFTIAGSALDEVVMRALKKRIDCRVTNIYGTTEAMNSLYVSDSITPGKMYPSLFNAVRVIKYASDADEPVRPGEEGELAVSMQSPAMFLRYLADERATQTKTRNGWYRTGDAAIAHDTGEIEVLGRMDDTIISGGENIHPHEVEEIIIGMGNVKEVAVVGLPDPKWGEVVVAAIVAKDPSQRPDGIDELVKKSALANFKRPRSYIYVDAIPKNSTGKVDRRGLVGLLLARSAS